MSPWSFFRGCWLVCTLTKREDQEGRGWGGTGWKLPGEEVWCQGPSRGLVRLRGWWAPLSSQGPPTATPGPALSVSQGGRDCQSLPGDRTPGGPLLFQSRRPQGQNRGRARARMDHEQMTQSQESGRRDVRVTSCLTAGSGCSAAFGVK